MDWRAMAFLAVAAVAMAYSVMTAVLATRHYRRATVLSKEAQQALREAEQTVSDADDYLAAAIVANLPPQSQRVSAPRMH